VPWKESTVVNERMIFITRLKDGERMAELCRDYGISRKTGYKFKERFERLGPIGLADQSRAPVQRRRIPESVARLVLELRRQHPTWGPKKLLEVLGRRNRGLRLPGTTSVSCLIAREGLAKPHRKRSLVPAFPAHLTQASLPNDVWCADYKGQFRLATSAYCYPLTVSDEASRFLIGIDAFDRINSDQAREAFEEAFSRYGLPDVIRTDNGAPFAGRGILGLTRLSVFWIKQGIRPERIQPGEPQQNGRHERMHRTLKEETTRPAAKTFLQQQERFDCFIDIFNRERPHEALGMATPAERYRPSNRAYAPRPTAYPLHDDIVKVHASGHVGITRRRHDNFFLSSALAGESIGVRQMGDHLWLLSFAQLNLGVYDASIHRFQPAETATSIPLEA
jgi:transposase InsO family protein